MQEEMDRVEQHLRLLSQAMRYPRTPALAQAVRRRLEMALPRPQPARPWQLAIAAVAAIAVVAAAAAGSIAPARDAVADFFDRINIFETEEVPPGLPTEITGTPLTLEEAGQRLGFAIRLPSYPEGVAPERVLLQDFGEVKTAVVFFEHPNGVPFELFETKASVGKGIPGVPAVGKGVVEPGTQVTFVDGLGNEAYWLVGLRIVQYYGTSGNVIPESVRATDVNTLIWDEGGVVFRLEGDLSQEEAVRIAKSIEPQDKGAAVPSPTAGPYMGYWITCAAIEPAFSPDPPIAGRPTRLRVPREDVRCAPPPNAPQETVVAVDFYRAGDKPPAYVDPGNRGDLDNSPEARLVRTAPGVYEGEIVFPEPGDWWLIFRDEAGSITDSRSVYAGVFIPQWSQGPLRGSKPVRIIAGE